jgi:uncharacterized membrane protein YfcA
LLPGPRAFDLVVGSTLVPLGVYLAGSRPSARTDADRSEVMRWGGQNRDIPAAVVLVGLSAAVGCVGGIYGIGGGSILAPILIGAGRRPAEVAPATLASTFVTSVAGVITFAVLALRTRGPVAPDWPTGIALGLGGVIGAYTGARIQRRLPEMLLRRVMALLVIGIGARYLIAGAW